MTGRPLAAGEGGAPRQRFEQDPDTRAAFVLETCGDDAALRAEVESLLAAHERAGSLSGGVRPWRRPPR